MTFDQPAREAYRRGALDLLEAALLHLPGPQLRALQHWVHELEAWTEGSPPAVPDRWTGPRAAR